MALVSIDVVRGLASLPVLDVPSFMDLIVNSPKVNEGGAIVRALELRSNKWRLIIQVIDEELDFVKYSDMVIFVLDLEVAVL
jgi:hypothetical protein